MTGPSKSPELAAADLEEHERRLESFEAAWQAGPPPAIESYLPPDGPARRELLEELIKIDLEYRWRQPGQEPPARPRLEDYVKRFPELCSPGRPPLGLVGEEYRARQRWGDRPAWAEYTARFSAHGPELRKFLAHIDAALAEELARVHQRRATSAPEASALRCPHCHHVIAVGADLPAQSLACPSCGGSFSVETLSTARALGARPPRPRVGRYELRALLGTGAFGSVWHAWDTELAREVAVKLPRSGQFAGRIEEERFLREARYAAQLRHPGIVAVHDVGRDQDTIYLVSDLVRGQSLEQRLKTVRLSFTESAELVARVAEALDYAHRQGVVHRDVKPANILLQDKETRRQGDWETGALSLSPCLLVSLSPKITDFGLAKRDAGEVTMTLDGQVLGTPAYMSPEQVRDPHAVDGRGDVYSLGVILYQLLTGELPFHGTTRMLLLQVVNDEPRPPRRLNDKVPRDLETICLKCLQKDPARRYRTASALAVDLRRWLAGEAVRARPAGAVERLWRWARRNKALALAGGVAAVAVVAVLGAPAAAFLVAVSAAAALYAIYQGRAAAELGQAIRQLGQDQLKTAAALEMALKQCHQLKEDRERATAATGQAQRRFGQLRQLAHAFIFDFHDQLTGLVGSAPAREFLVQTALTYLDRLREEAGDDPVLLRELAAAYGKVGDMQAGLTDAAGALASYQRSVELSEVLARDYPDNTQVRIDLSAGHEKAGDAWQILGRFPEALASYHNGLEIQRALAKADPHSVAARRGVAACCHKIGNVQKALGQTREALASYREGLEVAEALAEGGPATVQAERDRAVFWYKLGMTAALLGSEAGETAERRMQCWREARACYQRAWDIVRALGKRGTLPESDAGVADMLAAEISRCDAALARDEPSRGPLSPVRSGQ